jgi:hypothetical protein
MAELGTVERAYADGYAAAQHKIDRLQAVLKPLLESYLASFGGNKDELAFKAEALIREIGDADSGQAEDFRSNR